MRILVGYDDKDASVRALERALAEAKQRHARLLVVTVLELPLDPNAPRNFGTLSDGPPGHLGPELPDALRPAVEHAQGLIAAGGVPAELLWAAGEPAEVLVELAQERDVSLIVLGEHHHGLFSSFLGTDVTAEVQRRAGADVLVVD